MSTQSLPQSTKLLQTLNCHSLFSLPDMDNNWHGFDWHNHNTLKSKMSFHFLLLSLPVNVIRRWSQWTFVIAVLVWSRLDLTLTSKSNVNRQLRSWISQPWFCSILCFNFYKFKTKTDDIWKLSHHSWSVELLLNSQTYSIDFTYSIMHINIL